MRGILQLTLAIAMVLVALPLHAQNNSGQRPGTDHSVTTGIGTSSSFKNAATQPAAARRVANAFLVYAGAL